MTRMCENLIACYIGIFFLLLSYNCTVVCLFWAQNKPLNSLKLRGFLFLGYKQIAGQCKKGSAAKAG